MRLQSTSDEGIFESFADMMIASVAVFAVLLLFFILQIRQNFDSNVDAAAKERAEEIVRDAEASAQKLVEEAEEKAEKISEAVTQLIYQDRASGGSQRPMLVADVWSSNFPSASSFRVTSEEDLIGFERDTPGWALQNNLELSVQFLSPSLNQSKAGFVKGEGMVSPDQLESWDNGSFSCRSLADFWLVLNNIKPGNFFYDNNSYSMALMEAGRFESLVGYDEETVTHVEPEDEEGLLDLLTGVVWNGFENGQLRTRSSSEFSRLNTTVYFSGLADGSALEVGQQLFTPYAPERTSWDGFAFQGLSSGRTEFVYLGEPYTLEELEQAIEKTGSTEARRYYDKRAKLWEEDRGKILYWNGTSIPKLNSNDRQIIIEDAKNVYPNYSDDEVETLIRNREILKHLNILASRVVYEAYMNGDSSSELRKKLLQKGLLPTTVAFPAVFENLINIQLSKQNQIPDWVQTGLLDPLGFTRLVVKEDALEQALPADRD